MSNMSYCRFENTASDLRDCIDHMDESLAGRTDEWRARRSIIKMCREVAENYDESAFSDEAP